MRGRYFILVLLSMVLLWITSAWGIPVIKELPYSFSFKTNLPPDTYIFRFSLWDTAFGGMEVWSEEKAIKTKNKKEKINTNLGSVAPLDSVDFSQQLWIQVEVYISEIYTVIDGRTMLELVPYALWSKTSGDTGFPITEVVAGAGLTGGGDTGDIILDVGSGTGISVEADSVSIDTTAIQRRVTGTCPSGQAIRQVYESGLVECQAVGDGAGGDITAVIAGNGLSGGGETDVVSLDVGAGAGITVATDMVSITANGVTNAMLSNDAVTSDKIAIGAVTTTKLSGAGASAGQVLKYNGIAVVWDTDLSGSLNLPYNGQIDNDGGYGFWVTNTGDEKTWPIRMVPTAISATVTGNGGIALEGIAEGTQGYGVYARSSLGHALFGYSEASDKHSGFFESSGEGLNGATLYSYNSNAHGIALYARNEDSDNATAVFSNFGTGYLIKGFGGDGGEHEFAVYNDGRVWTRGGVYAQASSDDGVHGESSADAKSGVYGFNSHSGGYGIFGRNTATGNYAYLGGGTYGVYGESSGSSFAAGFKGNVRIISRSTGSTVIELGEGLDYAEGFHVSNKNNIKPGNVLVIDPFNPGKLMLSDKAYDTKVAGIVAGAKNLSSAVRLGVGQFDHDVALAGRVYCNVDAKHGKVSPGDLLTTSPTPGYAMVVKDYIKAQGAILGKAMERLPAGKKGLILVLVTLQ